MNNNYNDWSGIPQGIRPPVYKNDDTNLDNQSENQADEQVNFQEQLDNTVDNTVQSVIESDNSFAENNEVILDKNEFNVAEVDKNNFCDSSQQIPIADSQNNNQYQPNNTYNVNQQPAYPQKHNSNYYSCQQIVRNGSFQQHNGYQQAQYQAMNTENICNGMPLSEEGRKQLKFKESLKKTANRVGGSMLLFWGFSQVIALVYMIPLIFTNAYSIENNSLETITLYVLNAILLLTSMPLSGIMLTKMTGQRLGDVIHLKKNSLGNTVLFTVASMGFVMVFNILLSLMNSNLSLFGFTNKMSTYGNVNGIVEYIIYFFSITFVPAIAEEFLFRGAVLGALRKYGDIIAIIMSSALFGIMHGNLVQTPVTFLTGLILGYLTVKTGSIIPSMILHFVNNTLAVITEYLYNSGMSEDLKTVIDLSIMVAIIFAGLICTILLLKIHNEKLFAFEKAENAIPLSQQIGSSFATPCTIIFILLMIVSCVLTLVTDTGLT
ncbi:MAG: type II CAAX endopeptidase family protein [Acutalibacteraceae bacterium]